MGSSVLLPDLLAREPGAAAGIPFARFMELALFHPQAGYYAANRHRVGRDRSGDFYTATSLGPVFGELVVAAAVRLLGPRPAAAHTFVEIGAEPGQGVLQGVAHPFAASVTLRLGEPLTPPPRAVVFSNELFDAQPCHRLVRRGGAWRELGVAVRDGGLAEVELPALSPAVAAGAERLPADTPEDYHLDLPLPSVALLTQITRPPWTGLFIAVDYGRTWRELTEEMPAGTARAFSQHRQGNDLLANPGAQDLTCDVCWDWLEEELRRQGFTDPRVESQEAFLARHAGEALAVLMVAEAGRFSARKQAVLHLLHPAHMGQKFQILHALRD
ncbi:MAG: SAM-dependent methyltransferase [Opitutales bacterium]